MTEMKNDKTDLDMAIKSNENIAAYLESQRNDMYDSDYLILSSMIVEQHDELIKVRKQYES